jgi:hypothetical protein
MKRSRLAALAAALVLGIAGCSGGQAPTQPPSPTPVPTPAPTPTPTPSATPVGCDARTAAAQVEALLAGEEFESHYLTINGQLTVSVWLVDPQIESAATSGLSAGNWEALRRGLEISYRIVDRIPCIRSLFENVNPMIVDAHYNSWYIDIIPVRAFVGLKEPTTTQLIESVSRSATGPAAGRRSLPHQSGPTPSGACTWPQARAGLKSRLGPVQDNTAAYMIVGGGIAAGSRWGDSLSDVAVQAQIETHRDSDTDDAVLLARLGEMTAELACVSPRVDQLEVFVVNGSGTLVVYARVPGAAIVPGGGPLPAGQVLLHHYPLDGSR